VWEPGEHNGTFRGNNAAFVTATAALDQFWRDDRLERGVAERATIVEATLVDLASSHLDVGADTRGRGLVHGLVFSDPEIADAVCREAFHAGLLVESSGPRGEVVKLMPPLTIELDELRMGLEVLAEVVDGVVAKALAGEVAS